MPSDVNKPEDSSSEDQRNGSDSQTDKLEFSQLDGELQLLAEKPGIADIMERLTNPTGTADDGDGDSDSDDLDNHNEDEEGKETEKDGDDKPAEPVDDDAMPASEDGDDEPADKKVGAPIEDPDGEDADSDGEKPAAKPPAGGEDDPDEDERQGYSRDANKRIRQLIDKRKAAEAAVAAKDVELEQLREKASYRDVLEKTLSDNQVSTKAWDEWTQLGLLMQRDPGRAAVLMATMAKSLGYQDPEGPITKIDKDLEEMVTSQDMTKEAAEKIQRSRIASRMPAPPVPRQPQQQQPPIQDSPDPRSPSLPRLTRDDTAIGHAAIKAVDAEFRKKYPDQWPKLVGEVQAEMALYKGSAPSSWGKIARESAEKIVAKRMAKAPKSNDRPDPGLRAQGGSSRAVARNNTGPAKSKSELAERLSKGTLFRR